MNISISNIAWDISEEQEMIGILKEYAIQGIEIALTKIWNPPINIPDQDIFNYKTRWNQNGIELVAMQSLLFNRPDLTLFDSELIREQTKNYLKQIILIAEKLKIKVLVFGSPKNRLISQLNKNKALDIAIQFFSEIGQFSDKHNLVFCIEPNPAEYGCDFIKTTEEGIELVKEVNHPGFRLHLDAATITLNHENIEKSIKCSIPFLSHFHISEPYLELIGSRNTNHSHFVKVLREIGYEKWVSIEMKNNLNEKDSYSVRKALEFVTMLYQ